MERSIRVRWSAPRVRLPCPDFSTYRVRERVRGLGHNVLIAAAGRHGVRVRVLSRDPAVFTLRRGRRRVLVTRLEFGLNTPLAKAICHRKEVTRVFLQRAKLPIPQGAFLRLTEMDLDTAVRLAARLGLPLVLKPPDSHGGQLTYPGVRTRAELRERLRHYLRLGVREVLAERQVEGRNYRLLALSPRPSTPLGVNPVTPRGASRGNGRLIGLSERLPPILFGDGRSTIRELVGQRNAFRRGTLPVLKVLLDVDAQRALRRQGFTPSSVPARGRAVRLHDVTNVSKGGTCRELLREAHPGWRVVTRRILRAIPGSRLLGADVIARDITKSPRHQRWWIIEVNANPEIELHHFPWEGTPSDAASAILHALFVR